MHCKTEIVPNAKRKTGNGNDMEHRPNETEQNENVTVILLCTVHHTNESAWYLKSRALRHSRETLIVSGQEKASCYVQTS